MDSDTQADGSINRIIVIGTSAGGLDVLRQLVSALPADLPAAICIVQHLYYDSESVLPQVLSRAGPLPALHPRDGEIIEPGHIYVAPPDFHMLLDRPGIISLNHGARENLNRPAIDPLFRSAAHTYGPRITGVILTGTMDDGAAGMLAVKLYGGQTVVQHPDDALYPELPRAMLEQVEGIDYVVPLSEMAALLVQLAHQHHLNESETRTQAMMLNSTPSDPLTIEPDVLICPECGGALTEVQLDRLVQYQCHTGHIFSLKTLQTAYSDEVEHALWAALRALKEKAILNRRLAQRTSIARLRVEYQSEAEAAWTQASVLQELLAELGRLHYMKSTE